MAVQGLVQGDSSNESQNEYYRVASSIELVRHNLLLFILCARLCDYCSEEAILQAAGNGDIEKLRELNERGTNFRVTDTVSIKLYARIYAT